MKHVFDQYMGSASQRTFKSPHLRSYAGHKTPDLSIRWMRSRRTPVQSADRFRGFVIFTMDFGSCNQPKHIAGLVCLGCCNVFAGVVF